jgi:hypothetical protein
MKIQKTRKLRRKNIFTRKNKQKGGCIFKIMYNYFFKIKHKNKVENPIISSLKLDKNKVENPIISSLKLDKNKVENPIITSTTTPIKKIIFILKLYKNNDIDELFTSHDENKFDIINIKYKLVINYDKNQVDILTDKLAKIVKKDGLITLDINKNGEENSNNISIFRNNFEKLKIWFLIKKINPNPSLPQIFN